MFTEHTLQELSEKYELPLSVRKSNWFGDFYFVVEEITKTMQARGKRYRNGNYYDDWSCSIFDYFVLKDPYSTSNKVKDSSANNVVSNPNNLRLNKSTYFKGVTKLFVQRDGKLVPAVFDHFGTKNGSDVIYVECEGKVSFYPFPQSTFLFQNKDDGAAAVSKKKRTYGATSESTSDSQRIIAAYNKLPMAQIPFDIKEREFEYETAQQTRVQKKLSDDLIEPKQAIVAANASLHSANEDYREACIDARENGGYFDDHTFISLQLRSSTAEAQKSSAERKIEQIHLLQQKPYFARVDCGKTSKEIHTAYLGDSDIPGYVVDWRRPEIGNAYYNSSVLQSREDIIIALKRTFDIQNSQLLDFDDEINIYNSSGLHASDKELEESTDALLTKLLSNSRNDKTTHDIIKTIQSEQYDIITSDFYQNAVINGCAGSGKTMILYHRLSYIAYNHSFRTGKPFIPERVYVISPSDYFDASSNHLLKKLSIDTIHHGPLDVEIEDLICSYCSQHNIIPFQSISPLLQEKTHKSCEIYNEDTFSQFNEFIDSLNSSPSLKTQYDEWITGIALHLLVSNGFEIGIREDASANLVDFDQLYHSEYFLIEKQKDRKDENAGKTDKDGKSIYHEKEAITTISYENVIASLDSLSKSGNTYQNRAKRVTQYSSLLKMCLSTRTKKYSNGKIDTNLIDFWSIFEKSDIFKKLCILILAEKLLAIASGKENSDQDFLLRCIFAFQTTVSTNYANNIGLYCLKALTAHYGSIVKEPAFIFVDEFQNYSVFELSTIKAAFSEPTFNLYGDFDQRIEKKGIELQGALDDLLSPQMYNLNINYRNAKQITEYINKSVYKNMQPIGIDGTVAEMKYSDCKFSRMDRTAIIGKDTKLISKLLSSRFGKGSFKIASEAKTIDDSSLMLLSVSECKGLEFDTVYVFNDEMTESEKYVAYTRALDNLVVITDKNISDILKCEEERAKQEKPAQAKVRNTPPIQEVFPERPSMPVPTPKPSIIEGSTPSNSKGDHFQQEKETLPEEPNSTDQCDDIYLEAIQLFSSDDPDELSYAISLLERIMSAFSAKLTYAREKKEEEKRASYRANKRCQYCGGEFSGFFTKVCKNCGRKKDY